jgi:hypothetical protein
VPVNTCQIDKHYWETMLPEGIYERAGALDDTGDRTDGGRVDNTLLKIDTNIRAVLSSMVVTGIGLVSSEAV